MMNTVQPDYSLIVTVGLAGAVALSFAVIVLMQVRPRFSLRALLIIVTLVAACVAAYIVGRRHGFRAGDDQGRASMPHRAGVLVVE